MQCRQIKDQNINSRWEHLWLFCLLDCFHEYCSIRRPINRSSYFNYFENEPVFLSVGRWKSAKVTHARINTDSFWERLWIVDLIHWLLSEKWYKQTSAFTVPTCNVIFMLCILHKNAQLQRHLIKCAALCAVSLRKMLSQLCYL